MKKLLFFTVMLSCIIRLSAQDHPVKVQLSDDKSFSMIIFPDPQSYSKFDVNQPIFDLMTAWVANNAKDLKIKSVLCTGDLVEQNEIRIPNGTNGNQTSEEQWSAVSRAFERLDNKVHYVCCTGNHDYGYVAAENRMSRFPHYFPAERNSLWRNSLVEVANNAFGVPTLENAAFECESDTWGKLLIVAIEFDPRQEAIDWAKQITTSDKYKDHKVIILTHSYMHSNGDVIEKEGYKLSPTNYGKDIWEQLIYPSDNIIFLICGHACNIGTYQENVAFRIDKNSKGREIPQMMFNAQTADGKWSGNGGDGWLRILEFKPDGKTISVRTYSPLLGISPLSADKAWRTDAYDQFTFTVK